MLPDIDSLALFVRAAELHSLTKAADASHIGAAAASRRIALLEHRFKTPLLERSPRGVELTPAGTSLLAHAKALLAQLNGMEAIAQFGFQGSNALEPQHGTRDDWKDGFAARRVLAAAASIRHWDIARTASF
ncbi:LysR family transcriptional regulator [Caballeronia sp. NCTM5]|uniref:helix-turn-helix domain-containing protein n=1 Tax=Caballeronia sp. NCTM5 TaxID=2921755 RepID=UPI00202832A0|nr:LysR family transcriptional regulator [Caballeronia sp. NCTM5]